MPTKTPTGLPLPFATTPVNKLWNDITYLYRTVVHILYTLYLHFTDN